MKEESVNKDIAEAIDLVARFRAKQVLSEWLDDATTAAFTADAARRLLVALEQLLDLKDKQAEDDEA